MGQGDEAQKWGGGSKEKNYRKIPPIPPTSSQRYLCKLHRFIIQNQGRLREMLTDQHPD